MSSSGLPSGYQETQRTREEGDRVGQAGLVKTRQELLAEEFGCKPCVCAVVDATISEVADTEAGQHRCHLSEIEAVQYGIHPVTTSRQDINEVPFEVQKNELIDLIENMLSKLYGGFTKELTECYLAITRCQHIKDLRRVKQRFMSLLNGTAALGLAI